ncbi:hypothetical protein C2L98_13150 [Enterococcus gallinarum]|nr:hypothetical protein C2L98_13150 [Enterococcus gallinarum]TFV16480.1 hypothetical protein E4T76_10910 [Enterococcus gallinarum]
MRFKRIFTAIIYTSIVLITRASLTGFTDGVKSFFFTVSFFSVSFFYRLSFARFSCNAYHERETVIIAETSLYDWIF